MTASFNFIPSNLRTPGFYAEVSSVLANTNQQNQVSLLFGQMLTGGNAAPNIPVICSGVNDAIAKCGAGSMLALMVAAYVDVDSEAELWILPVADNTGGTAATGTITLSGTATAAGNLNLYIAGCPQIYGLPLKITVPVIVGMTAAQAATALNTAIAATANLPASSAVAGAVLTLTALHKGIAAGDVDIRMNYLGTAGGESTPAGLTVTIVAMSGGALNPVLTTALSNLGDQGFDFICNPYTDATSLAAMTSFLADANGRWSYQNQVYGHAFGAVRTTYSGATTLGLTLNDQHATIMPFFDSPTPSFVWAAGMMAAAAASLRVDPALPLQTVGIPCVLAPPVQSRFTQPLRNTLLYDGMSTFKVDPSGNVSIDDLITTYRLNGQGTPDNSYLQVETLFTLIAYLRAKDALITTTYARFKLVADGTRVPPGGNFITPSLFRAALIAQYQSLSPDIVQDPTDYAAGLTVTINSSNPSRLDVQDDPILTGGLRIVALQAQFQQAVPANAATAS
jgi:phage tail sheath gpL-like